MGFSVQRRQCPGGSEEVTEADPPTERGPGAKEWRVILLARGGAQVSSGKRLGLSGVPLDIGSADVVLSTRHVEMDGCDEPIPQELIYEVRLSVPDADTAVQVAGEVGSALSSMIAFGVNAYVPAPPPYLAYEAGPGLNRRQFWQRHVQLADGVPPPARLIDETTLFEMLQAMFSSSEAERIARAVSQYHVALSHWTTSAKPLALAHLYMALEALAPVVERRERRRLGLDTAREHAIHRKVDVSRNNWKEVLLGWVRRDVVCQGDRATYDAARNASDGFEHGSMPLPEFRAAAELHGRGLIDYVRGGILNELELLPRDLRDKLAEKRPLDVSPLWLEVRGELHGAVDDPDALGAGDSPFPFLDWRTTLKDVRRLDDGRLRMTPVNHLTAQLAPDVLFTPTQHSIRVGLSDADLFDVEPAQVETVRVSNVDDGPSPSSA
jgi:hypothetical protein